MRITVDTRSVMSLFKVKVEDLLVSIDFIVKEEPVSEDFIFTPVPLTARIMANGVQGTQNLSLD